MNFLAMLLIVCSIDYKWNHKDIVSQGSVEEKTFINQFWKSKKKKTMVKGVNIKLNRHIWVIQLSSTLKFKCLGNKVPYP
jgi:hypothetical protein